MESLLPKHLTGVSELQKRTGCVGQNVVVAVLDTGVDPGAAGLDKTPDGRPKIIDIVDCTGDGDVNMSKLETPNDDFIITGTSGRSLKLGSKLCELNQSSEFHVGHKFAYDLLPPTLIKRMKEERSKEWNKINEDEIKKVMIQITQLLNDQTLNKNEKDEQLEDLEARKKYLECAMKYEDLGPVYDCITFFDGVNWRAAVNTDEDGDFTNCKILEDYKINCKYQSIADGVLVNFCVNIFEDGNQLSIVTDTGTHGTHVAGIVAGYFPESPVMNGLAPAAQIVSLKIGDARLKGMETHRGIMRAVSYLMKHSPQSDSEIRVDIANMSYGEPTKVPDSGLFVRAVSKLIRKYNVMFIASGGNSGPALSSVGAPGGTTSDVIGVGAYVTRDMILQSYSQIPRDVLPKDCTDTENSSCTSESWVNAETPSPSISALENDEVFDVSKARSNPVPGMPYTWCSRGPAYHGSSGINICAPGGAIAPVSSWSLQKKQLMHGTSMSSPSAAGAIAVLLSFLKAKNILYSTASVRRVVEYTARYLSMEQIGSSKKVNYFDDLVFAGGAGSIDVLLASQYLESYGETKSKETCPDEIVKSFRYWNFDVSVTESLKSSAGCLNTTKGIYLRGNAETKSTCRFLVSVKPSSPDDDSPFAKDAKASMELILNLKSESNWVSVPESIVLTGKERSFPIYVDPCNLEEGKAHYCRIFGFNKDISNAPLFFVPVTIIKPEVTGNFFSVEKPEELKFSGGAVLRKFIHVPYGATMAKISVKAGPDFIESSVRENGEEKEMAADEKYMQLSSEKDTRIFVLHTIQVLPTTHFRNSQLDESFRLQANSSKEFYTSVSGGKVFELCLAQNWSSMGCTTLEKIEINFQGLTVSPPMLISEPMSEFFQKIEVSNQLKDTHVRYSERLYCKPSASLSEVWRTLTPLKSTMKVLGDRHSSPESGKMIQMKLEYVFQVSDDFSTILISFSELAGSVYEAEVEGGPYCLIIDGNGRIHHFSDIYPGKLKLTKGTYYLESYISSTNIRSLDKLKNSKCQVMFSLKDRITIVPYGDKNDAVFDQESRRIMKKPREIVEEECLQVVFAKPDIEKLPKWIKNGDVLKGSMYLDYLNTKSITYLPFYYVEYHYILGKNEDQQKQTFVSNSRKMSANNDSKNEAKFSRELFSFEEQMMKLKLKKVKEMLKAEVYVDVQELIVKAFCYNKDDVRVKLLDLENIERRILNSTEEKEVAFDKQQSDLKQALALADEIVSSLEKKLQEVSISSTSTKERDDEQEALRSQVIEGLFRKVRLLEYASHGDARWICMLEESNSKFCNLAKVSKGLIGELFAVKKSEIEEVDSVILAAKREKLKNRLGKAIMILESYFSKPANAQKLTKLALELKLEILQILKMKHLTAYQEKLKTLAFSSIRSDY